MHETTDNLKYQFQKTNWASSKHVSVSIGFIVHIDLN